MQTMHEIDFDEIVDVPDTPDRVALNLGRNIAADTLVSARLKTYNRMNKGHVEQSKMVSKYTNNRRQNPDMSHQQNSTPISVLDSPSPPINGPTLRKCSAKCEDLEVKLESAEVSSKLYRAESSDGSNAASDDLSCNARIGEFQNTNSFSLKSLISSKGKSKMDEPSCTGARCPAQKYCSRSIRSTCASSRKRLVRNGCISPNNIARAKTSDQKNTCIKDAELDKPSMRKNTPCLINIKDSSLSVVRKPDDIKGKGVMSSSSAAKGSHLDGRKDNVFHKEAIDVFSGGNSDPFEGMECLGGWRSIASKNICDQPVLDNGLLRGNGESRRLPNSSTCGYPEEIIIDVPNKRQKREEPDSRNLYSSSRMGSQSDIPFCASIMQSSDSLSATTAGRSQDVLEPLINVEESSPQERESHIQHIIRNRSCPQLEADEKLARELQEQFYHEGLDCDAEVDSNLAWMLQHEEDARFSASSSSVPRTVINIYSSSQRRPQPRINQRTGIRRGNQSRNPASNRMMQLRRRFRGHSSSRMARMPTESIFNFPVDMDVDMRMDILEALEDAVGNVSNIETNAWRDFNEDDYEMLLALDDNNHEHAGASCAEINNLPLSTVQSDNTGEACLICLEALSVGEAIRHLPCVHKFHKDCIDPWLGRKTSCPVCRLSITENSPMLPGC